MRKLAATSQGKDVTPRSYAISYVTMLKHDTTQHNDVTQCNNATYNVMYVCVYTYIDMYIHNTATHSIGRQTITSRHLISDHRRLSGGSARGKASL